MSELQLSQLEQAVIQALRAVKDPDLHRDIVTLNFVKDLKVDQGKVSFTLELTTPACPVKKDLEQQARNAVLNVRGIQAVEINMTSKVPESSSGLQKQAVGGVKNIIAVGSGKGGVGKSTVTVNLAVALAKTGARVGLMDADVYGPNVPRMMGVNSPPSVLDEKIVPLEAHGVKVISLGFLIARDQPAIWRGPIVMKIVNQFLRDDRSAPDRRL